MERESLDEDGMGASAEHCSTSQQLPLFPGAWPRGVHARRYAVNNKPSIRYVPLEEPEHDDFTREPTTYTQLLASIRNAKTVKRLQHLVTTCNDRLDAVHVAAAIARLPALLKSRTMDVVDRSGAFLVTRRGAVARTRGIGTDLLPRRLQDATRLASELDSLVTHHAQHFFPRQAACSIWAFGELHRRGVVQRMESLPDVLLAISKGDMEPLRVHGHSVDLAQLIQGLAKLGYKDPGLMARLVPLVIERLDSMQQREIMMVAWGLAWLGYASRDVMDRVADQLVRTGTAFLLPSGCARVLWAFARAGVHRPDLLASLAGSMLGQAVLLTPGDVASALWACSKLGYMNPDLVKVLGDVMVRCLNSCSDAEASSAVESLGNLGFEHTALLDAVSASIRAEPVIGADPVCIVRVLNAFAKLGRRGPQDLELVEKLARALRLRLPIVPAETLAAGCVALDRFGYADQDFLSAVAARAEVVLPDCGGAQLVPILRVLGNGGLVHYQLAVASARHLQAVILPGGTFRGLGSAVEVLYLCARQGVEDPEAADTVLALAASRTEDIRPVDAARLMVIGQVMNKHTPLLSDMADKVSREAAQLDRATAEAVLRSAKLLGRADVVAALAAALESGCAAADVQQRRATDTAV